MIKYCLFRSSSVKKDEADTTVQFQQCIKILADKVYLLTRQSAELLERYSAMQAVHGGITKELDEKKELIKNLYNKLQLEKQVCLVTYSLRIRFRSRLGQRHGLQNTTLTSCFYKKIFMEK
jgi:hypothetical protein